MKIALQYANESIDIINDNSNAYDKRYAGFYNSYAEIVAQASEEGDDISEELFEKAIEYINKAFMYYKNTLNIIAHWEDYNHVWRILTMQKRI